MDNRATITIDDVATPSVKAGRFYASILAELQHKLQDKGDDPRYQRVVLAPARVSGEEQFRIITERGVELVGVFPRYVAVPYGYDGTTIKNIFGVSRKDTLIVAANESTAQYWETELRKLNYQLRRI